MLNYLFVIDRQRNLGASPFQRPNRSIYLYAMIVSWLLRSNAKTFLRNAHAFFSEDNYLFRAVGIDWKLSISIRLFSSSPFHRVPYIALVPTVNITGSAIRSDIAGGIGTPLIDTINIWAWFCLFRFSYGHGNCFGAECRRVTSSDTNLLISRVRAFLPCLIFKEPIESALISRRTIIILPLLRNGSDPISPDAWNNFKPIHSNTFYSTG